MMIVRRIYGMIVGVSLVLVFALQAANATEVLTISIDMDSSLAGIQDTRFAVPGEMFPVDLVFHVGPAGLSSFGVSVQFDTLELDVISATEAAADTIGFQFNLSMGVGGITEDIGDGLTGQVSTFEAATFGPGPFDATFVAGTIDFQVASAVDDGIPDVTPGLFNTGIDGLFDNAGFAVAGVTYNPGFVTPEPSSIALLLFGGLAVLRRRRGRSRPSVV